MITFGIRSVVITALRNSSDTLEVFEILYIYKEFQNLCIASLSNCNQVVSTLIAKKKMCI